LDGLDLCGVEPVSVPDPEPAGREQVLLVGGRRVVLPADPRPAAPPLDVGPVALVLGATSFLTQSLPRGDGVPLPVTLLLAAAAVGLAWWAHRRAERGGPGRSGVLVAALVLGAADAVLATVTMRNPATDHLTRFPFLLFLIWFGPLLILYAPDLTDRARWLLVGGAGATVATGFALLHVAAPAGPGLVALVWPASANLACLGLRDILARDEADAAAALERRHATAVEGAYRQGRRPGIRPVAPAATHAWNPVFQ